MSLRDRNSRPTVVDVAREAGVSPATAARALGDYGQVSPAKRRRVARAAIALGYHPNTLARSMVTGSTQTIGVVVTDIENSFFARAVRGITDSAREAGFEIILANTDEDVQKERAVVALLLRKRVDGLIVVPASDVEISHLSEAINRGYPVVLFDRAIGAVAADAIVVDSRQAAYEAVMHLTRLGHRRIALISEGVTPPIGLDEVRPDLRNVDPTVERFIGYTSALGSAGLPVSDELVTHCRYNRTSAAEQTRTTLDLDDPPTALFTTDGVMTLGAVNAIVAGGLRVPDDVSIVAFDDLEWTTIVQAPMTVVTQPVYEMGVTAAERLIDRLRGDERPPEVITLQTTFIERASTGPPPSNRG